MLRELIKLTLPLAVFLAEPILAQASSTFSPDELSKLPLDVQKFVNYNRHLTNDLGYAGINVVSFEDSKNNSSISAIVKKREKKDYPIYTAVVSDAGNEVSIIFRNYRNCNPTSQERPISRNIKINDQKIAALYLCMHANPKDETNTEVYKIKNNTGKEFAKVSFENNMFVFVTMDGVEVPFQTTGFSEVWEQANEPAL